MLHKPHPVQCYMLVYKDLYFSSRKTRY